MDISGNIDLDEMRRRIEATLPGAIAAEVTREWLMQCEQELRAGRAAMAAIGANAQISRVLHEINSGHRPPMVERR